MSKMRGGSWGGLTAMLLLGREDALLKSVLLWDREKRPVADVAIGCGV